METIKNAIGLGTAPQEGREPVSGVSGSGTAGEPYDQGNVDGMSLLLRLASARMIPLESVADNIDSNHSRRQGSSADRYGRLKTMVKSTGSLTSPA